MNAGYEYIALIMIPAKNNTGATNHCLDLVAGLICPLQARQQSATSPARVGLLRGVAHHRSPGRAPG
jgi:hypothetical protein